MTLHRTIALLFATLLSLAARAETRLHLALDRDETLPFLPPSLLLTFSNDGPEAVAYPGAVALRVITSDGRRFWAVAESRQQKFEVATPNRGDRTVVAAGESVDLTLWANGGAFTPSWFDDDARLSEPGSVRLQVVIGRDLDSEISHTASNPVPRVTESNVVSLTLRAPVGVDATVYEQLKSTNGLPPRSFGQQVWDLWPSSKYATRYLPIDRKDWDQLIKIYETAIAMEPPAVVVDGLRFDIVEAKRRLMERAIQRRDARRAKELVSDIEEILRRLSRQALDLDVRSRAAGLIEESIPTPEEIDRRIAILSGEPTDVIAHADCVQRRGGETYVWFGYENSNRSKFSIPYGQRNRITPAPFDRVQPTEFLPGGRRFLVFAVKSSAPELIWHLDQSHARAHVPSMPDCPADWLGSSDLPTY